MYHNVPFDDVLSVDVGRFEDTVMVVDKLFDDENGKQVALNRVKILSEQLDLCIETTTKRISRAKWTTREGDSLVKLWLF